jgi:hypothetical protein
LPCHWQPKKQKFWKILIRDAMIRSSVVNHVLVKIKRRLLTEAPWNVEITMSCVVVSFYDTMTGFNLVAV